MTFIKEAGPEQKKCRNLSINSTYGVVLTSKRAKNRLFSYPNTMLACLFCKHVSQPNINSRNPHKFDRSLNFLSSLVGLLTLKMFDDKRTQGTK